MKHDRLPMPENRNLGILLVSLFVLTGLVVASQYNYLLFHTLVESFSILVAGAMFVLAWNTWAFTDNDYFQFLGVTFLFIGGLDFLHTLSYRGMDIFAGYDSNLPTQLWITARYLQSISLLIAPSFLNRSINRNVLAAIYLVLFIALLAAIFGGIFPDCYIEEQGLTPFKIASEYVISFLLGLAIIHLVRRREDLSSDVFRWMVISIGLTITSELAFTLYVGVYDLSNLVGHIFKIAAFYSIYRAIVEIGLRKPYTLFFKNMQEALEAHKESEEKFRSYIENAPYGVFIADQNGGYLDVNEAASRITGYTRDELLAMNITQLVTPEQTEYATKHFETVRETGYATGDVPFVHADGSQRWWSVIAVRLSDTRFLAYTEDTTERKRAEEKLSQTTERLQILHNVDTAILSARSSEEIASATLARLRELIPFQHASIAELDSDDQQGLSSVVLSDESKKRTGLPWLPIEESSQMIDCLQEGQIYLAQDLTVLENPSALEYGLTTMATRAVVSVPLMVQDKLIGSLNLTSETPGFFQPAHIEILEKIAVSLTVALQQARLLEQTQRDAEEKAMLLREVNHRILNNLTMILSLLNLERRRPMEDKADFYAALQDVASRIGGMTTVHRMLSSNQWVPLDLAEVVKNVIQAALSGSLTENAVEALIEGPDDPLYVSSKQAIAVALVINELTTNSVKYAFHNRPHGRIHVSIDQESKGQQKIVHLVYRDDGPGMPKDVLTGERSNVGLWLVMTNVTHTLGGETSLSNDQGAVVSMTFELDPTE